MREVKKVSLEELQFIFNFCKKKDIYYVDLRMELVDHLASRVEAIWEKEPNLSFQEAFHKVYKSFGIFGLSTLAEEHGKIVSKKYWSLVKQEFKLWLKPPQVFATLLFLVLTYFSLAALPPLTYIFWTLNFAGAIGTFVYMFLKAKRASQKLAGERSILLASPRQYWLLTYFAYWIPFQSFLINGHLPFWPDWLFETNGILFTTLFFGSSLIYTIANIKIMQMAEEQVYSLKNRLSFYRALPER